MAEDISLSAHLCYDSIGKFWYYKTEDAKEFINLIKKDISVMKFYNSKGELVTHKILNIINFRAGDKFK